MRPTLASLLVILLAQAGPSWYELGGSATTGGVSSTPGASEIPSLALDGSGQPAVAWQQQTGGNNEIYFRRWNGNAWADLGGSGSGGGLSSTSGYSNFPQLRLDSGGNPCVAWFEGATSGWEIYLKRWNGSSWVELGGSASGGGISNDVTDSRDPALALDADGNPCVAWVDY